MLQVSDNEESRLIGGRNQLGDEFTIRVNESQDAGKDKRVQP